MDARAARESTITFCNEQWTAESARLLLELDEGWVGFHNAEQWQWNDATYDLFIVECQERCWPCNSRDSCVSMLHALRSGTINIKISNALRSPQGFIQWRPHEMRALGSQMSQLTAGQSRVTSWCKQLMIFIDKMHGKNADYRFGIEGRTIEHFKKRASRYLIDRFVKEIEACDDIESDSSGQSSAAQQVKQSSRFTLRSRENSPAVVKRSFVSLRKTVASSVGDIEKKTSKGKTVLSSQEAVVGKNKAAMSVSPTKPREMNTNKDVPIPKNVSAESYNKGKTAASPRRENTNKVMASTNPSWTENPRKNVPATPPQASQEETLEKKAVTPPQATHAEIPRKNTAVVSTTNSLETESEDGMLPYRQISNKDTSVAKVQEESKSNDDTPLVNVHTEVTREAQPAGNETSSDGEQERMGDGDINDDVVEVVLLEVEGNDKEGDKDNDAMAYIQVEGPEEQTPHQVATNRKRAANWGHNRPASPRKRHTDVASSREPRRRRQRRIQHPDAEEEEQQQVERSVVDDSNSVPRPSSIGAQASRLSRNAHTSEPSANTRTLASRYNNTPKQYDPSVKPWGEFVVELLLAEKTARDEDELDYVRFVRDLYDI